jgi:hypothetical protein
MCEREGHVHQCAEERGGNDRMRRLIATIE